MRAVVVYNSKAGSGPTAAMLRAHFKKAAIEVLAIVDLTEQPLEEQLAPWLKKGVVIAAAGGDGTLSSVANMLVGTPAIFAPLPGGTLNHFTKDLGIPQDITKAIAGLATATPRTIDAARVNGRVFINNSSIGLYPATVHMREAMDTGPVGKWPGTLIASMRALIRYRLYTVTIGATTFKTPFLFVGNNDYNLVNGAGRTTLTGGHLAVYTITSASRWGLLKAIGYAVIGKLHQAEDVKIWNTASLTIHAKKPTLRVACDGEVTRLATPLAYESLPGALTVIGSW